MGFTTPDTTMEKFKQMLGCDEPGVLDTLDRSKFASDDAYLDAATKMALERKSPEYAETRRKLKRELEERREKEVQAKMREKKKGIRSEVQLSGLDVQNIDTKAAELARRDLAAGRISASGLGKSIEEYAKKLSEERKDEIAQNRMMNMFFRGQL